MTVDVHVPEVTAVVLSPPLSFVAHGCFQPCIICPGKHARFHPAQLKEEFLRHTADPSYFNQTCLNVPSRQNVPSQYNVTLFIRPKNERT